MKLPYTDEQIQFIRDHVGKLGDERMSRQIGLTKRQVRYVREALGLKGGAPCAPDPAWPDERKEAVRLLYVEQGLPATVVADRLGVSRSTIRSVLAVNSWLRPAPPRSPSRPRPVKPDADNDAELIAAFLASNEVTVLPPGTACGLSMIERLLYAAKPYSKDYTDRQAKLAARKRRAA